ncbi:hypothetical protein A3I95_00460 [Candidatus Nomurabacteria bacterium RIFCSPLOWO2_02_FULL_44_12]|nr:MAG: hypothetical protein A3I95_00460 [Candidatus Nomurabacteria bacterium RIFCSPLOWO2_02_FULL_44_12]
MKFGLALFLIFGFASAALAASPSSIGVTVAPENPAPLENVTISLNSYLNNLDSVLITWFLNGKNVLSGIGKKSFSLTAPAAGVETRVSIKVALPEGEVTTGVLIRPNTMILLWEATDSYVPPFYKGKALPTIDSEIKIVAMPEVKNTSPKNIVYSWKKDYTADQGASGFGRNFYIYINDYLEDSNTISVVASTVDGTSSESNITVRAAAPKIAFYRQDNGLGIIWEQALSNNHRIAGEEILVAIPYFISPKNLQQPNLVWTWSINNSAVKTSSIRKNFFPVKVGEGTSGTSTIGLQIENTDRIFQSASKQINVEF